MSQEEVEFLLAKTDADISASFPIIRQLRTSFEDESVYVSQVRRQMENDNYNLLVLKASGEVVGCAGFSVRETLSRGKYMYVEDLVASSEHRSLGLGDKLFDWLADHARELDCAQMEVVSGVQRGAAHRFYHRKRMTIKAFQLVLPLQKS